eukprot:11519-Heterococcus_DN1.PRE.2
MVGDPAAGQADTHLVPMSAELSPTHGAGEALTAEPRMERKAPAKVAASELEEYIKLSIEVEAPLQNVYAALSEVSSMPFYIAVQAVCVRLQKVGNFHSACGNSYKGPVL